jgi:osmoprotectant transport system substrate-binding protein
MPEYSSNLLFFYDTKNTARTIRGQRRACGQGAEGVPRAHLIHSRGQDAYVVAGTRKKKKGLVSIGDLRKIEPFSPGINPQFRLELEFFSIPA